MNETYNELVEHLLKKTKDQNSNKYFVGIAGSPGSGKSTISLKILELLNKKNPNICGIVGMDGFHFYKSELDKMENVEYAYRRRGSPFTFNSLAFYNTLLNLKKNNSGKVPSFDHKLGDPIEEDITITEENKIIIVEGNYLFLQEGNWKKISNFFDEKWFIKVDIDIAMERHYSELKIMIKSMEF
eukprot:gene8378-203_t